MPEEVQQSTPQPQVTTTKPHNWKKVFLTVVFILIAAGIIVGIYWFFVINKPSDNSDLTGPVPKPQVNTATPSATPSVKKDETANWRVYTNTEGKYTLNYPPDYKKISWSKEQLDPYTHQHTFQSPDYEAPTSGPDFSTSGKGSTFWVDICEGFPDCSYIKNEGQKDRVKNIEEYVLAGVKGNRFDFTQTHGEKYIIIEAEKDNKLYRFVLDYDRHDLDEDQLKIFNIVLSTFKFLD